MTAQNADRDPSPGPELAELRGRLAALEAELAEARAARSFLEDALDHVPVGLELYDADGLALWLNRAMVEFVALPSAEVAVGKFNVLTDPFSTQTGMVDFFRRAYAGELVKTKEFSLDTELATVDWGTGSKAIRFRMVLCPRRDAQGAVKSVLAVMYEVTQQRVVRAICDRILHSQDAEEACLHVVRGLVGTMDTRFARLWLLHGEARTLRLAAGAAGPGHDTGPLAGGSAAAHLAAALEARATVVLQPSDSRWGLPQAVGDALGLEALVVTPILGASGVLGLIEVGTSAAYSAEQLVPSALERIADQYAEFDARHLAQRRFESIFARSPDAVVLLRATGEAERSNEAAQQLFGGAPAHLDALLGDPAQAAALLAEALSAPSEARARWHELTARRHDGTSFPAEIACSTVSPAIGAGGPGVVLVVRDLSERTAMLGALARSVREKDTLLREVHHRVKNNLQVISSLLAMQAERLPGPEARGELDAAAQRVRAMSLVHQQLDGAGEVGGIDLGRYAQALMAHLRRSAGPRVTLRVAAEEVRITLDEAVPTALLLHELLTNAIVHGRAADGSGAVDLTIQGDAAGCSITVLDGGPGWDASGARGALGFQLVEALARQLSARVEVTARHDGPGTRVRVALPGR